MIFTVLLVVLGVLNLAALLYGLHQLGPLLELARGDVVRRRLLWTLGPWLWAAYRVWG